LNLADLFVARWESFLEYDSAIANQYRQYHASCVNV